jgi:hypothetical protein
MVVPEADEFCMFRGEPLCIGPKCCVCNNETRVDRMNGDRSVKSDGGALFLAVGISMMFNLSRARERE